MDKKIGCFIKQKSPLETGGLVLKLYPGRELNPHGRNGHRILSPACLPIPPPGQDRDRKSKKNVDDLKINEHVFVTFFLQQKKVTKNAVCLFLFFCSKKKEPKNAAATNNFLKINFFV
jgi:hypothetical protein